ncbi:c-type cytochrome [Sabulicella rubraurantiaca]|uniref:c-type cytochrome n=1 Tax=Sabulicella rubraurantiaca TaxID=2811429 RepID=UPI001A974B2A|nr:c-type cytochrome [Sabulicella rubraurantiaca]
MARAAWQQPRAEGKSTGNQDRRRPAVRRAVQAAVLLAASIAPLFSQAPAWAAGDAERGQTLASHPARYCTHCHGRNGVASTSGTPSLAGQPAEYLVAQMVLLRAGRRVSGPMADFVRGLADQQIEDLAAFFSGMPAAPPPYREERDAGTVATGEALAERMRCGSCHRPDYHGEALFPRLASQREDYLRRTLADYRDNRRVAPDTQMNEVMQGVSDADIAALAHYLAQLP